MAAPWSLLACLLVGIAVAQRVDYRVDFNADGRFSVDPDLAVIIDNLQHDIELIAVPSRAATLRVLRLARNETIEQQLQQFIALSPRLSYRFIDNQIDQPEMELLGQDLEQKPAPQSIYVKRDNRLPFRIQ